MRARAAIVLTAGLVVAGCGGGPGREEAVTSATQWLRAVGERDTDRACELMHESAVSAIRERSGLEAGANCVGVVRSYSSSFERGDVEGILKIGLEAEGTIKKDELGVFPKTGPRQLQVILMRRAGGEWKVASTTLGPTEPEATPTPAAN